MRYLSIAALALLAGQACGADDQRVSFLEQEVRNLQRQVQRLSWQVDQLQRPAASPPSAAAPAARAPLPGTLPRWIDAAKWRQLRKGMSELEVIASLGPPTSMREEEGARVLLYALEIGDNGFLGGSVRLKDRAVIEVRQPSLQ
ncbi:MAG TPA: hypothetical protein VFL16_17235 [Steroidobacteraceae bacterium]|jgi:hypothetical protein|nr:hypothetical protein [Steroidobacteraceae bacterium]